MHHSLRQLCEPDHFGDLTVVGTDPFGEASDGWIEARVESSLVTNTLLIRAEVRTQAILPFHFYPRRPVIHRHDRGKDRQTEFEASSVRVSIVLLSLSGDLSVVFGGGDS